MTLRTPERDGHTVWLPWHDPIAPGTLNSVLKSVAAHFGLSLPVLLAKLGLN